MNKSKSLVKNSVAFFLLTRIKEALCEFSWKPSIYPNKIFRKPRPHSEWYWTRVVAATSP